MTKLNGCLFSINPSKISSPETTNNINCAIKGLCKTADKFPGGKAALTALKYFTGMPIEHLLKNLGEKPREKVEQESYSGQKIKSPQNVREFVNLMCEYLHDAEISKTELYEAYCEFCKANMIRQESA